MVIRLATEIMARAVEHVTLDQGLDPRTATIVAGGGAAGLNTVELARSLGCTQVLVPRVAAALSAVGAISSPIISEYVVTLFASTADFPLSEVNRTLQDLRGRCEEFLATAGLAASAASVALSADARYAHQVWEIPVPIARERFETSRAVEEFRSQFDGILGDLRGMQDPDSPVVVVSWRARVTAPAPGGGAGGADPNRPQESDLEAPGIPPTSRSMRFPDVGVVSGRVWTGAGLAIGERVEGPGVIELPKSTLVLPPGSAAVWTEPGILIDARVQSRHAESKREEVSS
ncbi:MAG: N-methylhydantoinase [Gaiellales bacterium]|nr:N-methylhydantoinase [Gaiellales bacterium]